jgi:hypothetical protein
MVGLYSYGRLALAFLAIAMILNDDDADIVCAAVIESILY